MVPSGAVSNGVEGSKATAASSGDLLSRAKIVGELVVGLLGFAYICGFLVLYTFFNRFGIRDSSTELLRVRYIHTGLLCLAFPLFLLVPVGAHVWMYSRQRDALVELNRLRESGQIVGRSRMAYTVQLTCVGVCLYVFVLFQPYGAFHQQLAWVAGLLAAAVLPGALWPRQLGFAAENEHDLARWALASVSTLLLICALWGSIQRLAVVAIHGLAYWMFVFSLVPFVVQLASRKVVFWYAGQQTGVNIARWAIIVTLFILSTLAFAYRLFPLIPADKGGGNYRYSRDARVCLAKDAGQLPTDLKDPEASEGCSKLVKVLEITDSTLFVARSIDRGGAPAEDTRTGPELWGDGKFFPTVYMLPRLKLRFVQYYPHTAE